MREWLVARGKKLCSLQWIQSQKLDKGNSARNGTLNLLITGPSPFIGNISSGDVYNALEKR